MGWEQMSINKPHLAYLILGGFTSLFMLCSLFVKEKMYIGEATVATICGIIFGPHAANLFNPISWGNTDQITLECSRVVLVVQCFAVGVELPKAYMERHWKSVVFFLGPIMTYGWLATSLFIWWMVEPLTWLQSLMCAACVTATDPVLASSVVGKGKFAKRIPKHLRDILSAESGCNDGMAFPFIYLSYYLIHYHLDAKHVTFHWFCNTILYECIFGAVYGVLIGYLGRHAIKWADRKNLIDRESFLVFYFTLALFCAGTGATLGTDDLLVGFAAGVGFSNDGWFSQKTEESHVSNVIDLLLNLAYFVYLGSVIPWEQYSNPIIGLTPWRLVVISLLVLFFRRIPIVLALKPFIPDVKTWREALFAGHFGPIGVGAIFAAILARAELETSTTEPLAVVPTDPNSENYLVVLVIWPLTTFLVITSILVHGSSIAVFTLGKRINTLTLTMSYTQANEDGPSWMNRLPRIQSTAKGSISKSKDDLSLISSDEKMDYPPGSLPPIGVPGNFLRRQKEEDTPLQNNKGGGTRVSIRRKSKWDAGMGPGGPISQSAITPQRRLDPQESTSDTLTDKGTPSSSSEDREPDQLELEQFNEKESEKYKTDDKHLDEPELEAYEEGDDMVVEDEEGNVLSVDNIRGENQDQIQQHIDDDEKKLRADTSGEFAKGKYHPHEKSEGEEFEEVAKNIEHPAHAYGSMMKKFSNWKGWGKKDGEAGPAEAKAQPQKRGAAHAYQFGNTIIVEDEDGEVIKKYDIPPAPKGRGRGGAQNTAGGLDIKPMRQGLKRMGTWAGIGGKDDTETAEGAAGESGAQSSKQKRKKSSVVDPDDDRIRFTVGTGGRRMSKQDFIRQISQLDPRARVAAVEGSDVPEAVKDDIREGAEHEERKMEQPTQLIAAARRPGRATSYQSGVPVNRRESEQSPQTKMPEVQEAEDEDRPQGHNGLTLVDSNEQDIPFHPVADSVNKHSAGKPESAAQRRRRMAASRKDSDDDGTARVPPHAQGTGNASQTTAESGETQAERRRRLAALGQEGAGPADDSSDSDDSEGPRQPKKGHIPIAEPGQEVQERRTAGIRFADSPAVSQGKNIQWGEGVGKKGVR
ncbi:MAG: hypothetical protein L6R38_008209 [Xanthoria sp. 2 TBL-2021]|nr:MAG: hypothetical protein L6R38_008209 [Xanthoria sp. 2 TBL-2021]